MDGTPQVVRFDATTLWHLDAAEWAPSTASLTTEEVEAIRSSMSALPSKADKWIDASGCQLCAISGCKQSQQRRLYSIISSARPRSGSGTVRPNALAVFKLMMSSTFVACWTGRSAGLSVHIRKIRSIAHEAASRDELAIRIYPRQRLMHRLCGELFDAASEK